MTEPAAEAENAQQRDAGEQWAVAHRVFCCTSAMSGVGSLEGNTTTPSAAERDDLTATPIIERGRVGPSLTVGRALFFRPWTMGDGGHDCGGAGANDPPRGDVLAVVCVPVGCLGDGGSTPDWCGITRSHSDIEFWVRRSDGARSKEALANAGSAVLATQPTEESCEFVWDGVRFIFAYFGYRTMVVLAKGHVFLDILPHSFDENPGLLFPLARPAMSIAGMLAMKEQYPTLRNGRPLRDKDIADIALLRRLRPQRTVSRPPGPARLWTDHRQGRSLRRYRAGCFTWRVVSGTVSQVAWERLTPL